MILIDGKKEAAKLREELKQEVLGLKNNYKKVPGLTVILIGEMAPSQIYVRNKEKSAKEVGLKSEVIKYPESVEEKIVLEKVKELNKDDTVSGILVQLPLPKHLNEFLTTSRISPIKDVDGLTPHNAGLLAMKKAVLVACTPSGVMEMFDYHNIELEGKNIVLINRSNLVGKPLYHLLLQRNSTVTTCHSRTLNLQEVCKNADIVISGVGDRDKFTLTSDMIKENAIVIDVATTHHDGKLKGDSDFDEIISKASYASPVPGGVGPMTVAMLLKNTTIAAALSKGIDIKS